MTSDRRRLFKEVGIWTALIALTLVVTSVYNMFKPENVLIRAFDKTYNEVIVARDSVAAKNKNAQADIDLARDGLANFKEKIGDRKEYLTDVSTWSQVLDKAQNDNIKHIKTLVTEAKEATKDKKANAQELVNSAKESVATLTGSKLKIAQDFGKQLSDELNKKKNSLIYSYL